MKELEVIDRLRAAFPASGIGDDAAVLPAPEGELLFAADAAVEGVHFDRRFCTLSQAVQKLVTSNVSDIFAMGGAPGSIVFTAGLSEGCAPADIDGIVDGLRRSCAQYGVKLVGGDTVRSPGAYFFNVAITGEVKPGRAVLRSGARVGDFIVLFGEIGRSRAGLCILSALVGSPAPGTPLPRVDGFVEKAERMRGMLPAITMATSAGELERAADVLLGFPGAGDMLRFIQHHLVPLAYPLGSSLFASEPPCITAMIDVSDGIAKDLRTLCAESGVGAVVREHELPISRGVSWISGLDGSALADFALASGEEYVLLATVAPDRIGLLNAAAANIPAGVLAIGTIVPASEGIMLTDKRGGKRPMPELGYEHEF